MVKFYLGRPPYKIEEWIKNHKTSKLSDPLCFTAQQANSTVRLNGNWSSSGSKDPYGSDPYGGGGSTYRVNLEYKLEGSTNKDWSRYIGQNITLANVNDKMYMRATPEGNRTISTSSSIYYFTMTGEIAASGNIQTLLDQTGNRITVPNDCYASMFQNCTSLTQAPELPATTLAGYCYSNTFVGCTSLTQAPELPATTLAEGCYASMFFSCTSLTQAPELPATTLADYCYSNMFYNCTSLTEAPELPATTLAWSCYASMFSSCPKFSTVKMKASMSGKYNISTHGYTYKIVEYVL